MKTLHITNYKCFKDFKLENVARVNLFTGQNNTGKTSILEAIVLLAGEGKPFWITDIANRKFPMKADFEDKGRLIEANLDILRLFFAGHELDFVGGNKITINSEREHVDFSLYKNRNTTPERTDNEHQQIVRESKAFFDVLGYESADELELVISTDKRERSLLLDRLLFRKQWKSRPIDQLYYIDSTTIFPTRNGALWDIIALSDIEKTVIEALHIIEPKLTGLKYISKENQPVRIPVARLEGQPKMISLLTMGDGINKILNIVLALVNARDGFLLIDEFENGLHHSVQEQLWEIIFRLSEKLNVQVFVTTHSKDTVHAFGAVVDELRTEDASLYRLVNTNGVIKNFHFDASLIKDIERLEVEIR